jgi:hypothetical protein
MCDFVSVGPETNCIGKTVSTKNQYVSPYLIIPTEEAGEYTIAHEIAHAWLHHDGDLLGSYEESLKIETEAELLANEWDFAKEQH